jgi:acylphosphatase
MEVRANITVKGLVQGVGFRFFVYRLGTALKLRGTVRNLPNGDVRIVAEGERSLVEELIQKVKIGPRLSRVNDLVIEWSAPEHANNEFIIL